MRKKIYLGFVLMCIFSLMIPTVFAEETSNNNLVEVQELVAKSNAEIDKKIGVAVEIAEKEISKYLEDLQKLQMGDKVYETSKKVNKYQNKLSDLDVTDKKYDKTLAKLNKEMLKATEKLIKEQEKVASKEVELKNDIALLKSKIAGIDVNSNKKIDLLKDLVKFQDQLNSKDKDIEELNNKINNKINNIINNLIEDTNKISEECREKAAKLGYTVICEWIEVDLGGRTVLVDPLRIIGL